jgi:hypothetical protein
MPCKGARPRASPMRHTSNCCLCSHSRMDHGGLLLCAKSCRAAATDVMPYKEGPSMPSPCKALLAPHRVCFDLHDRTFRLNELSSPVTA